MQAIVYTQYGRPDVLHLAEVKKPAMNENQVLVRVHAASINASDWHFLTADPFPMRLIGAGLFKPKNTILGVDMRGAWRPSAETSNSFGPGRQSLEIFSGWAAAALPNMFPFLKTPWPSNHLRFHLNRRRLPPWQPSQPCKACATKDISSPAKKF
jgi:hypothetical protein